MRFSLRRNSFTIRKSRLHFLSIASILLFFSECENRVRKRDCANLFAISRINLDNHGYPLFDCNSAVISPAFKSPDRCIAIQMKC
jgi:hypothetical protein